MNFGEMQQQVLDRVGGQAASDADLVRKIRAFLNGSNRGIAIAKEWEWLKTGAALAVTATTVNIALPSNCRNVFHVSLASTGRVLAPRNLSAAEIDSGALSYIGRGVPMEWTTLGNVLWTIPYPAGADTLNIRYYANVVDMVADTDEPLLPDNHRQYLVEDTMAAFASADSFDKTIAQMAWTKRLELRRAVMHTSELGKADVQPYQMLRRSVFGGGTIP